jgi:tetratricopeptide (TPR) repeat protein
MYGPPPSAAAKARLSELMPERDRISNIEYAKDGETYKFERCKAAVDESPEFHRELLDRFFSAAWVTAYGSRLDPRRWKAPLGLPPGTRMTGSPHPDCGPVTVAATAPASAATSATVARMLSQGKQHLAAERPAQARTVLDSAVRLDPRNPKALYLLGSSLQDMAIKDSTLKDFYSEGDSIFQVAFALEHRDAELLVDLGDNLAEISGKELAYQRALSLNPPPQLAARARTGLGWFYYFFLSYDEAIPQFQEAIRLDPPNAPAVYAVGFMHVKMSRFPQARAIHRQLLQLDRDYATTLLKDINAALKAGSIRPSGP